jgi:esterase/lipase superfamily enzyme
MEIHRHSPHPQRLLPILWLLALASVLLSPSVADAASITGRVVSSEKQPVRDAMVTATHARTDYGAVALTDSDGRFTLTDLPPGPYVVVTEKQGYLLHEEEMVLGEGPLSGLNIALSRMLGAQPPSPEVRRPKNYATVSVFYGTDRKRRTAPNGVAEYGAERGALDVGVCEVSIPRDHRLGELESPSLWRLEFRADPARHVTLLTTSPLGATKFRDLLQKRLATSSTQSAFVFIHGYNVTFEDGARRAAQIAYDLGFGGIPMLYSWPSNGDVLNYVADGEQARRATRYLLDFLKLVLAERPLAEVHIIAHSMGNRVLTGALQELAAGGAQAAGVRLGQIALVAPDIDAEVFRTEIATRIAQSGKRRTLYASTRDQALALSKKLHAYARAGDLSDSITVVDGIDTIDATDVDTTLLGHSYFADNRSVIADLFHLIRNGAAPADRFGMRPMSAGGQRYWKFAP